MYFISSETEECQCFNTWAKVGVGLLALEVVVAIFVTIVLITFKGMLS